MNSREYQSLSLRTVPAPLMYWSEAFDGDRDATRAQLMCNCALGLAGEAAEIEDDPSSDEIGDGYWYAYVLFHVLGVEQYEPDVDEPSSGPQRRAHRSAGVICELVKKHTFHGRPFEDVRDDIAERLRRYVDALAQMDARSASATFDQNVDKLRSRYPDGFFERG